MDFEATICTGPTSQLTEETRTEYEALIELFMLDGIEGKITERGPVGTGVTWVEVTEVWLASKGLDSIAEWVFENALDAVSVRLKEWLQRKRKKNRPQSVVVKNLMNEPELRIEVDADGNVTEYRWMKVDPAEPKGDSTEVPPREFKDS